MPFHQYWLKMHAEGRAGPLEDYSINTAACRANKFMPRPATAQRTRRWPTSPTPTTSTPACAASTCAATPKARGVPPRRVVVDVELRSGTVSSRRSGWKAANASPATCSSIAGLPRPADRTGAQDRLRGLVAPAACDRAVAVPAINGPLTPYVRCTALRSGWQWRIPLQAPHRQRLRLQAASSSQRRQGAAHPAGDARRQPLSRSATIRFTGGKRKQGLEPQRLRHRPVGRLFLEPLESTSIHLINRRSRPDLLPVHRGFGRTTSTSATRTRTSRSTASRFLIALLRDRARGHAVLAPLQAWTSRTLRHRLHVRRQRAHLPRGARRCSPGQLAAGAARTQRLAVRGYRPAGGRAPRAASSISSAASRNVVRNCDARDADHDEFVAPTARSRRNRPRRDRPQRLELAAATSTPRAGERQCACSSRRRLQPRHRQRFIGAGGRDSATGASDRLNASSRRRPSCSRTGGAQFRRVEEADRAFDQRRLRFAPAQGTARRVQHRAGSPTGAATLRAMCAASTNHGSAEVNLRAVARGIGVRQPSRPLKFGQNTAEGSCSASWRRRPRPGPVPRHWCRQTEPRNEHTNAPAIRMQHRRPRVARRRALHVIVGQRPARQPSGIFARASPPSRAYGPAAAVVSETARAVAHVQARVADVFDHRRQRILGRNFAGRRRRQQSIKQPIPRNRGSPGVLLMCGTGTRRVVGAETAYAQFRPRVVRATLSRRGTKLIASGRKPSTPWSSQNRRLSSCAAHRRLVEVQVRLRGEEVVQEVPRGAVPIVEPRRRRSTASCSARRAVKPRIGPDVPVGLRVVAVLAASTEPRVLDRGVAEHLVDHHLQAKRMRLIHRRSKSARVPNSGSTSR